MCLKALKSLASYHLKEIGAGKIGLGSQVITRKDASDGEAVQEGVLSGFLKSLLQLLLFEDYRLIDISTFLIFFLFISVSV